MPGNLLDNHFNKLDNIMLNSGDFEGHIGLSRSKISFIQEILKMYDIKSIAEIGFNGGHSTAIFLQNPKTENVLSFDLCTHKYSTDAVSYIKRNFNNRFSIICGDSTKMIPKYNGNSFDLILVDGGHYDNIPFLDIKNSIKYLARSGTYILMDDTFYSFLISSISNHTVDETWKHFINIGKIKNIKSIRGLSLGYII